jgi:hypothetical protein
MEKPTAVNLNPLNAHDGMEHNKKIALAVIKKRDLSNP